MPSTSGAATSWRSGFRWEPTSQQYNPLSRGWTDERTPNHKYLPFIELWPCVLIGERQGREQPKILWAANSPGFDNPVNPKRVLDFFASSAFRSDVTAEPLERD